MKARCPICQGSMNEQLICWRCADILEFGYPSFPAYCLEDKRAHDMPKEFQCINLWNVSQNLIKGGDLRWDHPVVKQKSKWFGARSYFMVVTMDMTWKFLCKFVPAVGKGSCPFLQTLTIRSTNRFNRTNLQNLIKNRGMSYVECRKPCLWNHETFTS